MSVQVDTETGPLKKGYADTRDGQIHYRAAGVDRADQVPLFCFHQSPYSSGTYRELVAHLGVRRRTFAMDTPGFGESFWPNSQPSLPDYADWLVEAIDSLGHDRFDVLGQFTGAGIAADMGMRWPDRVRRVVLFAPPFFTQERPNREPWPIRPREDGSHLMIEWNRTEVNSRISAIPFERRFETFRELWRGGGDCIWGEEAVTAYPLKDTLPHVRQPTLVVHPDGVLADVASAAAILPDAQLVRLEGINGYTMLQLEAARLASIVNGFLDE
jgi:pimeloyl-ACP methyl ester carboxylesterase